MTSTTQVRRNIPWAAILPWVPVVLSLAGAAVVIVSDRARFLEMEREHNEWVRLGITAHLKDEQAHLSADEARSLNQMAVQVAHLEMEVARLRSALEGRPDL